MLRSLLFCTLALAGVVACAEETTNSDATGNLKVEVNTTGANPDTNGYTATVVGVSAQHLDPIDDVTWTNLPINNYSVQLTGFAANCTVQDGFARTPYVSVGTTTVHYEVVCP